MQTNHARGDPNIGRGNRVQAMFSKDEIVRAHKTRGAKHSLVAVLLVTALE